MKQLILIALIVSGFSGISQNTSTSVGLRGGGVSGLSIKIIDDDFSATEMILGFQMNGFRFTGLLQKYKPIAVHRIANFFIVSGIGGHAGYIKYNDSQTTIVNEVEYYSYHEQVAPIVGADLMLGFEYRFESIPINLSLDYKPYFELFGQQTFRMDFWDIGFTLRYNFN